MLMISSLDIRVKDNIVTFDASESETTRIYVERQLIEELLEEVKEVEGYDQEWVTALLAAMEYAYMSTNFLNKNERPRKIKKERVIATLSKLIKAEIDPEEMIDKFLDIKYPDLNNLFNSPKPYALYTTI